MPGASFDAMLFVYMIFHPGTGINRFSHPIKWNGVWGLSAALPSALWDFSLPRYIWDTIEDTTFLLP